MTFIEPGEPFEIEYGNGHRLTVKALGLRQKRLLTAKTREIVAASEANRGLEVFDMIDEVLRIAVGDEQAEKLVDLVDEEMAMEIATAVLSKQSLSEDDKKKSE